MATSTGKNTGYEYRPLQGDIATDILDQEDQGFKARSEKRLEDDRKALAAEKKQAKAKQALERAKGLNLYDTGSDTLNGSLAEAITIATNEYPAIFEVLDDDTGKYSQTEKIKAKLKYDNILNLPENLKVMTNAVMGEYENYQKGVEAGTIYRDPDFEAKFQNGFKGVSISLDDDGLPVGIFKKGQSDTNSDGIIDVLGVETMDSLNDVYSRPQFQKKYSYEGLVKQHVEKLESAINTTVDGFKTTKTTGVEVDLLDQSVDRILYDEFGKPTDIMKSFLREKGLDWKNPNKEDLDKVESDYKNDIYIRTKRGKIEDIDAGAIVSNKREDRLAKGETATLGEAVDPTKQTYSIYHGNIDPNKVNSVSIQGTVKIPAIKTEKGTFVSNATPHNVTRDKFGRMVVEVSYQDTKTETLNQNDYEKEIQKATEDEDFPKLAALQMAVDVSGGKRVTLPTQMKRKDITVAKEDEAQLAGKLGYSIEELNNVIYKNPEDANKKTISGF